MLRISPCVAMLALCLITVQCTAESEDGSAPSSAPSSSGVLKSGDEHGTGGTGSPISGDGKPDAPDPPVTVQLSSAGPNPDLLAAGNGGENHQIPPPRGGANNPNGSLPAGSSGSGVAGGADDKRVTTTTTSTAANAAPENSLPEADPPQSLQETAKQDQTQGTQKTTIQVARETHNNPSGAQPNEPKTVTITTTKPLTELEDKGSATGDTHSVPDKEHIDQSVLHSTVSRPNADPKQITPTPSRETVEGVPQHNGRQPSPTPDKGTTVVRDTNKGFSSEEQVHAPELLLEPHAEKGVSKDLTKTQHRQEQSPPLAVQPQAPQSTITVQEKITPSVPTTSTTTVKNKDTPLNNNPPTTSTASKLKVTAKKPEETTSTTVSGAVTTQKVPTNGDKETMPSTKSITSTSEPVKVESTSQLTPLPKLSEALQSLDHMDSSLVRSSLFALASLVTLVVMAVAPKF